MAPRSEGVHQWTSVEEAAPEDGDLLERDAADAVEFHDAVGDPGSFFTRARADLVDDCSWTHRGSPLLFAPGSALVPRDGVLGEPDDAGAHR